MRVERDHAGAHVVRVDAAEPDARVLAARVEQRPDECREVCPDVASVRAEIDTAQHDLRMTGVDCSSDSFAARCARGCSIDAPRACQTMQYVQRWLQPSCTLTNARERKNGASRASSSWRDMARMCSAMLSLSRFAKTESTVVYAPGFASTLHPVSMRCAPGSRRRRRRMRWRVVASACAVTVHELSTRTSAGSFSGTTSHPPAASLPARSAISAKLTLQPSTVSATRRGALCSHVHDGGGAAAASRSPAAASSNDVAIAPASRLGKVRDPRCTRAALAVVEGTKVRDVEPAFGPDHQSDIRCLCRQTPSRSGRHPG